MVEGYRLIFLLTIASVAVGTQYDGLRVKVGWSDALENIEYFFKIPRTLMEAEAEGWRRLTRPIYHALPELRLYCYGNRNLCALYDVGGFVAGLQISLPKNELEVGAIKPDKRFYSWRAPAAFGEAGKDYWSLPQFFVSEETLKAGAGPQVENGATLQDGGVWVYGLDGQMLRIPTTEVELNTTAFKKQNCVPNMGIHYYYNMTPSMRCENWLPFFALVSEGDLVGTGFQFFGRLSPQKYPDWFEDTPSPRRSAKMTIPNGPPCLYDWAQKYGVISVHIYYVDRPWNIRCKDGDSIKPGTAFDRMLLSGYRYMSKVNDGVRKIFQY